MIISLDAKNVTRIQDPSLIYWPIFRRGYSFGWLIYVEIDAEIVQIFGGSKPRIIIPPKTNNLFSTYLIFMQSRSTNTTHLPKEKKKKLQALVFNTMEDPNREVAN